MTLIKKVKNDLFDYPNRYIMQLEDGFKFSLDSILLAEYAQVKDTDNVLDMCSGNCPVPLILSTKTAANIVAFEIQKVVADLGKESIEINGLNKQVSLINDDIKNIGNYYEKEYFDVITCNPPYFKVSEDSNINKNDFLTIARHEVSITLEDIFLLANKYLKNNGSLYLVHRPERLDDIIVLGRNNKLNVKEVQLITTKNDDIPRVVIVKCVKNSNPGIKFKKEVCVGGLDSYQHIFR